MIKNIYVSESTHPHLYDNALELGLDITGDVITVDTETQTIYRFPVVDKLITVKYNDHRHIFDEIISQLSD